WPANGGGPSPRRPAAASSSPTPRSASWSGSSPGTGTGCSTGWATRRAPRCGRSAAPPPRPPGSPATRSSAPCAGCCVPRPRAVALVVAGRPEGAAEPLRAAAARLARAGATTIDLPPLADHDAAALVAAAAEARPSAEAVAEVVRLAEGNPFFLRELATALGRDGGAPAQPSAWGAIARRFVDLDAGTVAMLSRLALAQDRLD